MDQRAQQVVGMTDPGTNAEKRLQEEQYKFSYHYLPRIEDGWFTQVQY